MSTKVIKVYGPAFSSYVRSVMICCEELEIEYQLCDIEWDSEKLLTINPFGKVPVIQSGDFILYESAAIMQYLQSLSGEYRLTPTDPQKSALMHQWISIANCYLDRAFIRQYVLEYAFPKGTDGKVDKDAARQGKQKTAKLLPMLNSFLHQHRYFGIDIFSLADCLISPMLDYVEKVPGGKQLIAEHGAIEQYLRDVRLRDSCMKVLL